MILVKEDPENENAYILLNYRTIYVDIVVLY